MGSPFVPLFARWPVIEPSGFLIAIFSFFFVF